MGNAEITTEFLSRLFGGKRRLKPHAHRRYFLSRLFGGKHCSSDSILFLTFLSRLFGGKPTRAGADA